MDRPAVGDGRHPSDGAGGRKAARTCGYDPAIAGTESSTTIDVVRGRLDDATAEGVRAFWAAHGALDEVEAQRRLAEVLCVLRAGDGAIAGVCSAFPADLQMIGGRRLWIYRSLLPGAAQERFLAMFAHAFAALDAEYDGTDGEPIGLCALLDAAERRLNPEAEWDDPRTIYAGYLPDGRQARVAYFTAALSTGHVDWEREDEYRIVPFAEQTAVTADDVVALWVAENALSEAEARRRVGEILLIAVDADDRVAGVTTRYLQRNEQLRMDLWYQRAFTANAARKSAVGTALAVRARQHLEQAYVSGADRRAGGIVYEVESELLKRIFPNAIWQPTDFRYIGDSPAGAHVRVHFFPGVQAPEPS